MAKRRSKRRTIRAAPRRAAFRAPKKKSRRSKGGSNKGDMGLIFGSMIYGGGRAWASEKLAPLTARVPAGDYADEVVMGGLGYLLMKGKIPYVKKLPMAREIGRAALIVEAARAGDGLRQGLPMMNNKTAKAPVNKGFTGF